MNWENWISEPIIKALGWTLLHSIWQGALVAILLGIVLVFLKKTSFRYSVSLIFMGSILVLFIFTFFAEYSYHSEIAENEFLVGVVPGSNQVYFYDYLGKETFTGSRIQSSLDAVKIALDLNTPLIVFIWLLGTLIFSLRLIGGFAYIHKLSRIESNYIPDAWLDRFESLRQQMGIQRPIRWKVSSLVEEPITLFHLKPVILFPLGLLSGLTPEQIEAILIHELAHIRRADYLVNVLQSIIEIILFYHPAVWWISGRIRQERESCCDDQVMAIGMDPFSYAEALTQVQSFNQSTKPMLSMSAIGQGGHFTTRIKRLFGYHPKQSFRTKSLLATGLIIISLASFAFRQPMMSKQVLPALQETTLEEGKLPELGIGTVHEESSYLDEPQSIPSQNQNLIQDAPILPHSQRFDERVKIIIYSWTTDAELDLIKARYDQLGIILKFDEVVRDSKGKLKRISGNIRFPDGTSGSFTSKGVDLRVLILREAENGKWTEFSIEVWDEGLKNLFFERKEKANDSKNNTMEDNLSPSSPKLSSDYAKPLFIIDGVVKGKNFNQGDLDPNEIDRINVLKGEAAISKYGEDGVNGAVEVFTKKNLHKKDKAGEATFELQDKYLKEKQKTKIKIRGNINGDGEPLYILNGKVLNGDDPLGDIDPEEISYIEVLKDNSARAIYGVRGENGVILIQTKGKSKITPLESTEDNVWVDSDEAQEQVQVNLFPNAFRESLNIEFELKNAKKVSITIHDLSGRKVATVVSRRFSKGMHTVEWIGSELPSGVYSIHIKKGLETVVRRIVKE